MTPRAEAPPTEFEIDFSNPLNPATNYNNVVAQTDIDFPVVTARRLA